MTKPDNPVPSIPDLMAERRLIWEKIKAAYDKPDETVDFFDMNFRLDELLMSKTLSTYEALKWVSEEVGMLRDQVRDAQADTAKFAGDSP